MGLKIADNNYNDLYAYDTESEVWIDLSSPTGGGDPPSPRYNFGFICVASKIYLFAGYDDGELLL